MKKRTRLAAVTSAAALLVIGASMTSFAAEGWVEEDGMWFFYEKDGNKASDVWKKSDGKWYWLDSEANGAMAANKLIEDGDDIYYVDSDGVMVTNNWVKIANEEQDNEDDPAEYHYYYMQANGKAYKLGSSNSTRFKTIGGKRYAFDEDGKMLYGWVGGNGSRLTGEDDWAEAAEDVYYCGSWDDGAMKTGWQKIYVHDETEDDDMEHWFWFKSNGKRFYNDGSDNIKEKKINGKEYGFDARGVMVSQWTLATGSTATVSSWKYFSSPEDGARLTKGWFKVVAATEDNSFGNAIENIGSKQNPNTFDYEKADDGSEKWYYADGKGNLKANEIAKINGKYYAFAPTGYMLNGLVFMSVGENGEINSLYDDDVDVDDLDDIIDSQYGYDEDDFSGTDDRDASLYYFGSNEDVDGSMKTGLITVNLEGSSYTFSFRKAGGAESRGKGLSGLGSDKYIYKYGLRLKADEEDKYCVIRTHKVHEDGNIWVDEKGEVITGHTSDEYVEVFKRDLTYYRTTATLTSDKNGKNGDGEHVKYYGTLKDCIFLINTSGSVVKNKTAAKDGADWYFYVKDRQIMMYTDSKDLPESLKKWKEDLIYNTVTRFSLDLDGDAV